MIDRQRLRWPVGTLLMSALVVMPAYADLYKYRDPQTGRMVISNQPPPAGTDGTTRLDSTQHSAVPPVAPSPSPAALQEASPPTSPAPVRTDEGATAEMPTHRTKPIDTLELAHIKPGMSKSEVRQRLGEPAVVQDLEPLLVRQGVGIYLPVPRQNWVYPGNARIPRTWIYFEGEKVVRAERLR